MKQRHRKRLLAHVQAMRFWRRLANFGDFVEQATGQPPTRWQMEFAAALFRSRNRRSMITIPRRVGYFAARVTGELAKYYLRNVLESRPND